VCSLRSLELRRLLNDLILCFKIVHKLISLSFSDLFELDPNQRTRGHNYKIRLPLCKASRRQNFFAVRVVSAWNALPSILVNAESVNCFRKGVLLVDLSRFLNRKFDRFN